MNIVEKFLPSFCYYDDPVNLLGLVIHYFSGRYQFPEDRFNMQKCYNLFVDLNLPANKRKHYKMQDYPKPLYGSAKYLIGIGGEIWQLVPDGHKQYHAGKSEWIFDGVNRQWLNHYTDGIEIVNDGIQEYNKHQYKSLVWLIKNKYPQMRLDLYEKDSIHIPMPGSTITGHEFVSPGRKKDPGKNFNWLLLKSMIEYNYTSNSISPTS